MRTIVVPLDGSTLAEQALPYATQIASRIGADLKLISVYDVAALGGGRATAPFMGEELRKEIRAELLEYVRGTAKRIAESDGMPVSATVLAGDTRKVILAYAARRAPALIVLTTHGRRGPSRWWVGSVATDVLRRARESVLVIRPGSAVSADASAAASRPYAEHRFRRVLIALDGTPSSEEAIAIAVELAGRIDVEFILCRVVPRLYRMQRFAAYEAQYARDLELARADADAYLAAVAARPVFLGVRVSLATRVHEHEPTAITETAAESGADLIALGAYSRNRVERFVLGSVAERLVHTASVPVLVARAPRLVSR